MDDPANNPNSQGLPSFPGQSPQAGGTSYPGNFSQNAPGSASSQQHGNQSANDRDVSRKHKGGVGKLFKKLFDWF